MSSSFKLLNNALRSVCSRVKRVCGYNRTYLCAQRPVPRALYVYIYRHNRLGSFPRKPGNGPKKNFFTTFFSFFMGSIFARKVPKSWSMCTPVRTPGDRLRHFSGVTIVTMHFQMAMLQKK